MMRRSERVSRIGEVTNGDCTAKVRFDNHTFDQILTSFYEYTQSVRRNVNEREGRLTDFVKIDKRLLEPTIEQPHSLSGFTTIQ